MVFRINRTRRSILAFFVLSIHCLGWPEASTGGALGFEKCIQQMDVAFRDCAAAGLSPEQDVFEGSREVGGCRDFNLSPEEVRFFFDHARTIDGSTQYRKYDSYPCGIVGLMEAAGRGYKWKITPAGKGFIYIGDELISYLICDEECEDVFPNGGSSHE